MHAARRTRRSGEEARRAILDAAETRLREGGPSALRLQQIASDVGISHPAILHHFGSRDGLVRAVVARAVERLESDLIATFAAGRAQVPFDPVDLLDRVHNVLVEGGHARLVAWLVLSGESVAPPAARLRTVAEVAHARRVRARAGQPPPELEDTLFRTLLVALVMFGEATFGKELRESAGLAGDPDAPARFRRWLARLLAERG